MRSRIARLLVMALTVVPALAYGEPAVAAFPGVNGKIAFSNGVDVFSMRYSERRRAAPTNLTSDFADPAYSPSWSADGAKIAFRNFANIWVMNAGGGGKIRLVDFDPEQIYTGVGRPAWSPDGSKIAFGHVAAESGGAYADVFVVNADGSGLQNLTNGSVNLGSDLSWSPDGQRIAFLDVAGTLGLFTINADGGSKTRLTTGSSTVFETDPDWSPDGTQLVVRSTRDGGGISILTPSGDAPGPFVIGRPRMTRVTSNATDASPSWSADGTKIVFARSTQSGTAAVYSVGRDGTGLRQLSAAMNSQGFLVGPSWQPLAAAPPADFAPEAPAPSNPAPVFSTDSACGGSAVVGLIRFSSPPKVSVSDTPGQSVELSAAGVPPYVQFDAKAGNPAEGTFSAAGFDLTEVLDVLIASLTSGGSTVTVEAIDDGEIPASATCRKTLRLAIF